MNWKEYGWDSLWEEEFQIYHEQGLEPARVTAEYEKLYDVIGPSGPRRAIVAGRLLYTAQERSDFPAVGDWVAIEPPDDQARIHAVMPRRTVLSRKVAGFTTEEQILATNMSTIFVVTGLDLDFNIRRLERYLTIVNRSGAGVVVLLNKADLRPDAQDLVVKIRQMSPETTVHLISALDGRGVEELAPYLAPGETIVVIGSSGTGKSTLINRLCGTELATRAVRADDSEGRHTTSNRMMMSIPGGGVIIDSPGIREIQLWADQDDLAATFTDIEELAQDCRFRDCRHQDEPGCAVQAAVHEGRLDPTRWSSYRKLRQEIARLEDRVGQREARKARGKQIAAFARDLKKQRKAGLR